MQNIAKYTLPKASAEQEHAIELLARGNLVIDAVAGSGKTTTILHIAQRFRQGPAIHSVGSFPDQQILLLTYNARLKIETRERCSALGIENLEVHSYHSFGYQYVSQKCATDVGIIEFVRSGDSLRTHEAGCPYNIVIIDEAQDMSPLYFQFARKIVASAKVCILGDKFQSIYEFNGADNRFISLAEQVFRGNDLPWNRTTLSTSYRITIPMADFMNRCVLGYDRLRAVKAGPKPNYVMYNRNRDIGSLCGRVRQYLETYKPDDIFVLAPSVRGKDNSPIRRFANELSSDGILIYVPINDDQKVDEDVIRNKVTFLSFHQSKGLERKVVIVFNFDKSYFNFYDKSHPHETCPNVFYVALTRATEHLTILHEAENTFMPFLNTVELGQYANVEECERLAVRKGRPPPRATMIPVTNFLSHLSSELLNDLRAQLIIRVIREPGKQINIPIKTKQTRREIEYHEEVSDITGMAIPSYCQYRVTGKMEIFNHVRDKGRAETRDPPSTIKGLLKLANQFGSCLSGYDFKVNQIRNYNWLSTENLEKCRQRLAEYIHPNTKFEYGSKIIFRKSEIRGAMDMIDDEYIWEIKCVSELKTEHMLQVVIYSYMYEIETGQKRKCILYNLLSGEMLEITAPEVAERIIRPIFHAKYHTRTKFTNEAFLQHARADKYEPAAVLPTVCPECDNHYNEVKVKAIDWEHDNGREE